MFFLYHRCERGGVRGRTPLLLRNLTPLATPKGPSDQNSGQRSSRHFLTDCKKNYFLLILQSQEFYAQTLGNTNKTQDCIGKKLRVSFQKTQGQNSKTQVSEFLLIWSNSGALHKKSLLLFFLL